MIHALGYSQTTFTPSRPGRLCRGRERWIEPWPRDPDAPSDKDAVSRFVVTGAEFEDDSAARANRGLTFSGLDVAAVVQALLPRRELVAFCEDGHPADIPHEALEVELYSGHRAGGRSEELRVRWLLPVSGVMAMRSAIGDDDDPRIQGFLWPKPDVAPDDEALRDAIFLLTGMGTLDSPPARFQPAALAGLFETCRAVVLLHRDKHGPAVGLYTPEPVQGAAERVAQAAEAKESLPVRFAIPPMLARWDRALAEARATWLDTRDTPFPVPAAPESSPPSRRRGDRSGLSRRAKAQAREARGEE